MNQKLLRSLLPLALAVPVVPAWSQHAVTVPLEVERISNPGLTPESAGSVTLLRASPQYSIESVLGDGRTVLNLGAVVEHSSDTTLVASRTLPRIGFLWEIASPTSVLGLQASLEEASTRTTEFVEFGRVASDSTQRTGSLGASWSKDLTPVHRLALAAGYTNVTYDSESLVAYRESSASANFQTDLGDESLYYLEGTVARLSPEGDASSASRVGLVLGYETALTSLLELNAGLGVVRTSGALTQHDPVGFVRLIHRGERTTYAFSVEQAVGAGGAVGGYTRTQELDASMSYALTPRTSMDLGARRVESFATAGVAGAVGSVGSSLSLRFRSEISQWWAMTFALEGRRQTFADGRTANGHSVGVGFVYSHPDF